MWRHFQPGEGPSRGLLRDYEPLDGPSFEALVHTSPACLVQLLLVDGLGHEGGGGVEAHPGAELAVAAESGHQVAAPAGAHRTEHRGAMLPGVTWHVYNVARVTCFKCHVYNVSRATHLA